MSFVCVYLITYVSSFLHQNVTDLTRKIINLSLIVSFYFICHYSLIFFFILFLKNYTKLNGNLDWNKFINTINKKN